jgi:hypothetical protein
VSKFKVGDRVVKVRTRLKEHNALVNVTQHYVPIGTLGTIVAVDHADSFQPCEVVFDNLECALWPTHYCIERAPDRSELTTWEAVRASCGWMPGTVRA